jgi:hypothetical protein
MTSFPPFLQEAIMGETHARVREGLKVEVQQDVQKSLADDLENVLVFLVPEIMQEFLLCRHDPRHVCANFYDKYQGIDPKTIHGAVKIAQATSLRLDNYYIDEFLNRAGANEHVDWDNHQYSDDESSVDYPDSDEFLEN